MTPWTAALRSRSPGSKRPLPLLPYTLPGEAGRDTSGRLVAPWRVLTPPRTVELRDPDVDVLIRLPSGTPVALVSDRALSRYRLRRVARRAGVAVDRELVVVPTTGSPLVVLDDEDASVRHFWNAVAAVPPGINRLAGVAGLALRVARVLPTSWTGAVAPGRVLLGSRR